MNNSDTPANPTHYMEFTNSHGGSDEFYSYNTGLTKREAFAMAAMQGILAAGIITSVDEVADDAIAYTEELLNKLGEGVNDG